MFASVLADQVDTSGKVVLVESEQRAVSDAAANLAELDQVECHIDKVERAISDPELAGPDVVVLDPPRKGAERDVVAAIAARRPQRVVHVACDPAALARDLSLFGARGYELSELEAFDAFPMTHHVECIALLERTA